MRGEEADSERARGERLLASDWGRTARGWLLAVARVPAPVSVVDKQTNMSFVIAGNDGGGDYRNLAFVKSLSENLKKKYTSRAG